MYKSEGTITTNCPQDESTNSGFCWLFLIDAFSILPIVAKGVDDAYAVIKSPLPQAVCSFHSLLANLAYYFVLWASRNRLHISYRSWRRLLYMVHYIT